MGPASVLVVAAIVVGTLLMWRVRTPSSPTAWPSSRPMPSSVAVVVPARNEAARLPLLLGSLVRQDHRPDRLVVVDDGSVDGTADVARSWGAEVVAGGGPPAGWAGKTWACEVGTALVATADVVVLLDADVRLAPDALLRLVHEHAATVPDGLLSVQPYHETERAYEQLSAIANVVPLMASGSAAVRAPQRAAVAFGPCLVTTPGALAAVGGFRSVRAESIEDVALAGRYVAAGRPVRCLAGGATVRFRMYGEGLGGLVEGWTKNLAGGARRAPWWSTLGSVVWVAGALAAAIGLVTRPSLVTVVLYLAVALQLGWMLRRIGRFRWWAWLGHPVPLLAFVVLFARSAVWRGIRHRVEWRGRTLRVGG